MRVHKVYLCFAVYIVRHLCIWLWEWYWKYGEKCLLSAQTSVIRRVFLCNVRRTQPLRYLTNRALHVRRTSLRLESLISASKNGWLSAFGFVYFSVTHNFSLVRWCYRAYSSIFFLENWFLILTNLERFCFPFFSGCSEGDLRHSRRNGW